MASKRTNKHTHTHTAQRKRKENGAEVNAGEKERRRKKNFTINISIKCFLLPRHNSCTVRTPHSSLHVTAQLSHCTALQCFVVRDPSQRNHYFFVCLCVGLPYVWFSSWRLAKLARVPSAFRQNDQKTTHFSILSFHFGGDEHKRTKSVTRCLALLWGRKYQKLYRHSTFHLHIDSPVSIADMLICHRRCVCAEKMPAIKRYEDAAAVE